MLYAKIVVKMGVRTECKNCDFSDILEDEDVRHILPYLSSERVRARRGEESTRRTDQSDHCTYHRSFSYH